MSKRKKGNNGSNHKLTTNNTPGMQSENLQDSNSDQQVILSALANLLVTDKNMEEYIFLKNTWNKSIKSFSIHKYLESLKEESHRNAERNLEETNSALINEKENLEEQLSKLKNDLGGLDKEIKEKRNTAVKEAEELKSKAIEDGKKEAGKRKEEAKLEADQITKKANDEIKSKQSDLKQEKENLGNIAEALELKEKKLTKGKEQLLVDQEQLKIDKEEYEFKMRVNEQIRDVLKAKEQQYADACPDKVNELNLKIAQDEKYIQEILDENQKLLNKINENRLLEVRLGDKTAADLLKDNQGLSKEIEILENKCHEFSPTQLAEMKRALDDEQALLDERNHLLDEIMNYKSELNRMDNTKIELDSVRAQMQLIRSLNEQLKTELLDCKRSLDAQSGEVCPNLMRIDKDEVENSEVHFIIDQQKNTDKWTLSKITNYVRNYAATQKIPLYYTAEDMSAFIAGLASSKLAILQGLSGTGKTSLPIVFTKAISGINQIVSVESSWRDRNELLGYYNDFSKKFTAKEFTCALYKANHPNYSTIPYFIVLDEMNLSRIEYYFADFLSVLEKPDKKDWLVQLVDVELNRLPQKVTKDLMNNFMNSCDDAEIQRIVQNIYDSAGVRQENSQVGLEKEQQIINYVRNQLVRNEKSFSDFLEGPQLLVHGNTIKVPDNVWFIGTANRDESTFEISDKVYDRAQVLNFRERARKNNKIASVGQMAISYQTLQNLFDSAVDNSSFNYEEDKIVTELDEFLESEFQVSFGNRIGKQMNVFVPVYLAARQGAENKNDDQLKVEALDYQIANKVIRKLERFDMTKIDVFKDLQSYCEGYGLLRCSRIIDKRIKAEN